MAEETRDKQQSEDPQEVQDRREGDSPGLGEQARALREDLSPARVNAKLEEVVEERPKARHLLDFSIVGKALLAAVVVAAILWVVLGPAFAAIALVVVFLGGWLLGAQLSYDRRRETSDARASDEEEEEEDDDADEREREGGAGKKADEVKDDQAREVEHRAPDRRDEFEGDRGEAEARQEQETSSSNGTDPQRERSPD